jgi:integrase
MARNRRTARVKTQPIVARWAAFHALRHTYAALQLAAGANVVQLSRVLGHHSAAFTLHVYAHLLDGEEAPALDLSVVCWPRQPVCGQRWSATPRRSSCYRGEG